MSSYNHAKFIEESINSVLNQTYQDFELLIIDDNSTDNTFEIIKSFNSHKIKAVKNQQNVGMVLNTNRLISIAKCEYIAIMALLNPKCQLVKNILVFFAIICCIK